MIDLGFDDVRVNSYHRSVSIFVNIRMFSKSEKYLILGMDLSSPRNRVT
jgi:hypothetical protein